MPTVLAVPKLALGGEAVRNLRKRPVLWLNGIVYSRMLAKNVESHPIIAEILFEMGLKGDITPLNIQSLREYGAVFTRKGRLIKESEQDISAAIREASAEISEAEMPVAMTAFEYLTNPNLWKPKILDVLGITNDGVKRPDVVRVSNKPIVNLTEETKRTMEIARAFFAARGETVSF